MPNSNEQIVITLVVDDQGTRVVQQFTKNVTPELKKVEETTKKATSGMMNTISGIGTAFSETGRRLTLATAAIAGGLMVTMKGLMSFGHEIYVLQERTGIAAETLSSFKLSAEKSGTSIQAVARGMRTLATEMTQASKGGNEAARMFKNMDVNLKDSNGRLRSTTDIIFDVSEHFSKMENEAEKTSLALKLFGRYGMELLPMLNLGKKGLLDNAEAAKRLGIVMSQATAKAADELSNRMTELKAASQGVHLQFLNTVMPILTSYAQKVISAAISIRKWIEVHPGLTKVLTTIITNLLLFATVVTPVIWGLGRMATSIVSLANMGGMLKTMFTGLIGTYREMVRYQTALQTAMIATGVEMTAGIGVVGRLSLAFKALFASIGPVGWAILAIGAALTILPKLREWGHQLEDLAHGHTQLRQGMKGTLDATVAAEGVNKQRVVSLYSITKAIRVNKDLEHDYNAELAAYGGDATAMMDALEKGHAKYGASILNLFERMRTERNKQLAEETKNSALLAILDADQKLQSDKVLEAQYKKMLALEKLKKYPPMLQFIFKAWLANTREKLYGVTDAVSDMIDKMGLVDKTTAESKLIELWKLFQKEVNVSGRTQEFAYKRMGDGAMGYISILEDLAKKSGKPLAPGVVKEALAVFKSLEAQQEAGIPTLDELSTKYEGFKDRLDKVKGSLSPEEYKKHRMALDEMGMSIGKTTGAERAWYLLTKGGLVTKKEERQTLNDLSLEHERLDGLLKSGGISQEQYDKAMIGVVKTAEELGVELKGLTRAEQGSFQMRAAGVKTIEQENKAFGAIRLNVAGLSADFAKGTISEREYEKGMAENIKSAAALGKTITDLSSAERGRIMLKAGGMKTIEDERRATQDLNDRYMGLNASLSIGKIYLSEYVEQMKALVVEADKSKKAIEGVTEAQRLYYLILASGVLTAEDEQKVISDSIEKMAMLASNIGKGWSYDQAIKGMEEVISTVEKLNPALAEMMRGWMRLTTLKSGTAFDKQRMAAADLGVTLSTDLHKAFLTHVEDLLILTHASGTAKIGQKEIGSAIGKMVDELEKAGDKKPLKSLADGLAAAYEQMKDQADEMYGEDIGMLLFPDLPGSFWPTWVKKNLKPQYLKNSINASMAFLAGVGQVWAESLTAEAEQVRASITENMNYAEKKAVEHRAIALENFAGLVSGISLAAGNISNTYDAVYESLTEVTTESERTGVAIMKAIGPQVWGMIGTSLGQMISGAKSSFGSLGAAIGSSIGSIVGKIPGIGNTFVGKIAGELGGLLGGLIGGLFKKKKTPEQLAAEQYQKWVDEAKKATSSLGKITDATAKSIADFRKQMKENGKTISEAAAQAFLLSTIMEDIGLTLKNVNNFWTEGTKAITEYKKGQLTAKQATESLANSFTMLLEHAKEFGTYGSKAMVDFIAKVKESGLAVKEVTDFIQAQLGIVKQETGTAAGGLLKMATYYMTGLEELYAQQVALQTQLEDRLLRGMAKVKVQQELAKVKKQIADIASSSGAEIERMGRRTFMVFAEMVLQGASFNEAMESLGPTLDLLIRRYEIMGKEAPGGIKEIMNLRKLQNENKTLFDAIQGNLDVMTAVSSYRKLDQSEWEDAQAAAKEYYDRLITAGASEREALIAIQPTLERMVFLHGQYNDLLYSTDVGNLIKAADATGLIKKQQVSLNDIMLSGFAELLLAMGKVETELPKSMRDARKRMADLDKTDQEMEDRREEREGQRERDRELGKLGVAEYTDAVVDSTTRIDSGMTTVIDDLGRTSDGFRDAGDRAEDSLGRMESGIEGVRTSLEDANASLENFATNLAAMGIDNGGINVQTNTSQEPTISGAGGGAWQVLGREQLFRAHQGETVRIDRGEGGGEDISAILNRLEAVIQSRPVVQQDVTINVSTLDADSFKKVTVDKLVPELMKLSKAEKFKTHPNSVRSY